MPEDPYFCCLEALQNAAKHAAGAPVNVHIEADEELLTWAVCDEGPGFDCEIAHSGTGLEGMLDRMAAVGGMLEVVTVVGQGTTVRGRAPLEAAGSDAQVAAIVPVQAATSDAEPNSALVR